MIRYKNVKTIKVSDRVNNYLKQINTNKYIRELIEADAGYKNFIKVAQHV